MDNVFDNWNKIKKTLNERKTNIFCHEKEIWWCSLGINVGFEENGKNKNFERPVLILKKFNKNILWILPLTSKIKANRYYRKFNYKGVASSVILSQIRTISNKRLLRKIGKLDYESFRNIRNLGSSFLA